MLTKIGAVTIGQSPRDDILPDLKKLMGVEIVIEEIGVLDNLEKEEIRKLSPRRSEDILMTRLRNKESVALDYGWVVKGIRKCLADLRAEGVETIALLCTCHFSELEDERGLIQVSKLMEEKVKEMIKKGCLGVLIPSVEQILQSEKRWQRPGVKVIVASASPYGQRDEIISASNALAKQQVDLIVLDCIGYDLSVYRRIGQIVSVPVILPLELLAQNLKGLTSSLL
ncbi:MAG: hypothetical protein GTO17_02235 [Candidatus Aminicenantes bacterium]|nr:hypothetical protein [Candidatus Aminicenantes bacterium]